MAPNGGDNNTSNNNNNSSTNKPNTTATSSNSSTTKNLDTKKSNEEDPNCGTCTDFKTWMDSNRQNYYYPNNQQSYYSNYYSQPNGQAYSGQGYQTQSSYTNLYPSYTNQSSGYQQSQSTSQMPVTTTVTTTTRSSSSQPRDAQQSYSSSYSSSQPTKSTSTTSTSTAYDYDECPLFRDQLGRAAWTYLHQMAAHYPQTPSEDEKNSMRNFIYAFARFFPCRTCSRDFSDLVRRYPPKVDSQQELTKYFCEQHNNVNVKLGKPVFDCDKVNQRWKHSESKNSACNPNAGR